jgi:hypothetical protein
VAALALAFSMAVPAAATACIDMGDGPSPGWTATSGSTRAAPNPCPTSTDGGEPLVPNQVETGEFGTNLQGSHVMVPFNVPAGTDAVRVKYCYDQPESPTSSQFKHTLDLGIYDARSGPSDVWDRDEFRGWGGSSHPDVTVSPNGFSSEAAYVANPRQHVHGRTTRGFLPGPMPEGQWAVELGVAAVVPQTEGDSDGKVAWRVEIDLIDSDDYSNDPYAAAPYDSSPADPDPGWYAGDFHVHAEHSSLGDATMTETFDYAFGPLPPANGAGLDFVSLSDYVSGSAWGEIGRYQPDYPGKLIMRSAEVITYRGHANNHNSVTWADHRTGALWERQADGSLSPLRVPQAPSTIFDTVHGASGSTQINHPTIFPSEVPAFSFLCRGCPWDYSPTETDYSKVDAVEIATGPAGLALGPNPGPNPFTATAIQFWEDAIDADGPNGHKIAAVGSSDSHNAGRTPNPITQAPIGQATTVVLADELSERGIQNGVEAGHTYVKIWGNDGPDARLCAGDLGADGECSEDPDPAETVMGDTLVGESTTFTARVLGAGPGATRPGTYTLGIVKDGTPTVQIPITSDDFSVEFPSVGLGRYRLQVMRETTGVASIEVVSSPIYLETARRGDGDATQQSTASAATTVNGAKTVTGRARKCKRRKAGARAAARRKCRRGKRRG